MDAGTVAYLLTSDDDGETWTERDNPRDDQVNDVAHNQSNLWVLVGASDGVRAYVATSPDGVAWTAKTIGITVNTSLFAVAYDSVNDVWVTVGQSNAGDAYMLRSEWLRGSLAVVQPRTDPYQCGQQPTTNPSAVI